MAVLFEKVLGVVSHFTLINVLYFFGALLVIGAMVRLPTWLPYVDRT